MYLTDKQQLLEYKRLSKTPNSSTLHRPKHREEKSTHLSQGTMDGTVKYGSIFGGSDGIDESLYGRTKSETATNNRAIIDGEVSDEDELDSTIRAGRVGFDTDSKVAFQKRGGYYM